MEMCLKPFPCDNLHRLQVKHVSGVEPRVIGRKKLAIVNLDFFSLEDLGDMQLRLLDFGGRDIVLLALCQFQLNKLIAELMRFGEVKRQLVKLRSLCFEGLLGEHHGVDLGVVLRFQLPCRVFGLSVSEFFWRHIGGSS